MDRSLTTLLRSLQTSNGPQDAARLLPSAAGLLTQLTNPLNITILASQILYAPALWHRDIGLAECRTIFSLFYTASIRIAENSNLRVLGTSSGAIARISAEEWTKAVLQGANEDSPRWRHTLLIGGLLLGFGQQEQPVLPATVRHRLESALVTAANLSLLDPQSEGIGQLSTIFALNNAFPLLSDLERSQVQYEQLLPLLTSATFSSSEGLQNGYFVGAMDRDIVEVHGKRFGWSASSPTFHAVSDLQTKPLTASLGPLARLMAYALEQVSESRVVVDTLEELMKFSKALSVQWRQNKVSEIDQAEENAYLDPETLSSTMPKLWRILRMVFFAHIIVLRAILGRTLSDGSLANHSNAPSIAIKALHVLRNLYFISSRLGETSSSQYIFVNLTAIDILSQYPEYTVILLKDIRPHEPGRIPNHPVERCHDLFYLNTVEHFTNVLSPNLNEELAFAAASPYLITGGNVHLLEIFEAAHSVALAMFATPQCAELAAKHLPAYIDILFNSFPTNLSSRQFRLALKTAVKVTAPPSPVASTQPLLPAILLELVYERALHASSQPILQSTPSPTPDLAVPESPLSEQAALVLSIIDSLCHLPIELLREWLPLTASLIQQTSSDGMRRLCQERLWEALSNGEMDVDRAAVCVAWWTTQGGSSQVSENPRMILQEDHLMSGGLVVSKS